MLPLIVLPLKTPTTGVQGIKWPKHRYWSSCLRAPSNEEPSPLFLRTPPYFEILKSPFSTPPTLRSRLPCTDPKSGLRPEMGRQWPKNGFWPRRVLQVIFFTKKSSRRQLRWLPWMLLPRQRQLPRHHGLLQTSCSAVLERRGSALSLPQSVHLTCTNKYTSDPRAPHIQGRKIWTKIWIKYDPKCFKPRQIRQFGGHIFVLSFALYVGVGVSKRIPTNVHQQTYTSRWAENSKQLRVFGT